MTNFELTRADSGGIPVLRLKGRLTLGEGSKALRAGITEIVAEGHKYILLDMAGVTYVDSSGLGAMVAGYNSLKSKNGTVGLFQVPKRIQDLLEMSGLTAVFKVFHTEQEAVADQSVA